MPRGDKTGPMGEGPTTGRALGYCTGYDSPGFTKGFGGGMGRGRGQGFGGGMGRRNRFASGAGMGRGGWNDYSENPPVRDQKEELNVLKAQVESLKSQRDQIEQRIKDLENKTI